MMSVSSVAFLGGGKREAIAQLGNFDVVAESF